MALYPKPGGLMAPLLQSQAMATGQTTLAAHGFVLAQLATDAATGHPAQRWRTPRTSAATATFHAYYQPTPGARYMRVLAYVGPLSTYTALGGATFDLSIRDGAATVTSAGATIPVGLKADRTFYPGEVPGTGYVPRLTGLGVAEFWLDLVALRAAGLSATAPWRFTVVVACSGNAFVEMVQGEELSRFAVDDSEAFGVVPTTILPRALIYSTGQMERVQASLETAYDSALRTHHQWCVDETAGTYLTTVAGAAAAFTNGEESAGVALQYRVRGRPLRTAAANGSRFQFRVRYRNVGLVGVEKSYVLANTGGSATPYTINLGDITGAWVDSDVGTGYLATTGAGAVDTLYFTGYTDAADPAGRVDIDSISVWEYPAL